MKYLTLMVIPYPGAEVHSLRISHRWLRLGVALAALIFLLGLVLLFFLRPILHQAGEYDSLMAENQLLAVENQKLLVLTSKLEELDALVKKIRYAGGMATDSTAADSVAADSTGRMIAAPAMTATPEPPWPVAGTELPAGRPEAPGSYAPADVPRGMPVQEKTYITRSFNPKIYHFGIDVPLREGTPVRSTGDGTVTIAARNPELGFHVMLKHASGFSTLYAHNSLLTVSKGDRVRRGDVIAYSGNLGQSSAPHLHYAVFDRDGNPVDPLPFLEQ